MLRSERLKKLKSVIASPYLTNGQVKLFLVKNGLLTNEVTTIPRAELFLDILNL